MSRRWRVRGLTSVGLNRRQRTRDGSEAWWRLVKTVKVRYGAARASSGSDHRLQHSWGCGALVNSSPVIAIDWITGRSSLWCSLATQRRLNVQSGQCKCIVSASIAPCDQGYWKGEPGKLGGSLLVSEAGGAWAAHPASEIWRTERISP